MSAIILTGLGKSVAENTMGKGPEFAILYMLYEANGPVDLEEVCDETHMDEEKASMVVRRLISKEYIKEL